MGGKEIRTLGKDSGSIGRSSEEMDMVSRRHTKGDGGKSHSRRLGELLQTDNGHVDGGAGPGVVRDDLAADTVEHRKQNISTQISCQTRALDARLEFAVVKDPLGILLDVDVKVAVEQCLCGGGGQSRACSKGFFSHRSQMGCLGRVLAEVVADSGAVAAIVADTRVRDG